MNPARRRAIFRRLQAANPSPTTELLHETPFELLVAVMLSAHTTDKSVNVATRKLFPVVNTPAAIAKLGIEGVKPYLKTVGLYNMKAKNLIGLAQQIVDQHGGQVPDSREALEALPGVGRKTASIILNMVFGQSEVAVDTHIFRVANRTGLAPGKTPRAVEDELVATTPKEYMKDAHHWLLLHGRYVCVARTPACPKCIIADLCEYPNKTPPKELGKSDAPVVRRVGPRPAAEMKAARAAKAASGARAARPTSAARAASATQVASGKAGAQPRASGSGTVRSRASSAPASDARRPTKRKRARVGKLI
jgi:endonuclease III